MTSLTNFGDLAVLLPLASAIVLWLWLAGDRAALLWWLLALTLCVGLIGILKIYMAACPFGSLHSPSGHAGFATLVYGTIAACLAARLTGRWRVLALAAGGALIAGIALSRLVLGEHTPIEVAVGLLIGGVSLALLLHGAPTLRSTRLPIRPLLLAVVVIVVLLHGRELHAEAMLHAMGLYLAKSGNVCA